MSRHLQSGAGLAVLAVTVLASPSRIEVTAVRYWELNNAVRVVVETNGEFEYGFDRVPDPDRLFFDVRGSRLRVPRGERLIQVGNALLKQIRMAETQPGVSRVVFDLGTNVEYTASRLTNPDRLVVELRPASTLPAQLASESGIAPAPIRAAVIPPISSQPPPEPVLSDPEPVVPRRTPAADAASVLRTRERSLPPPPAAPKAVGKQAEVTTLPLKRETAKPAKMSRGSESMTRVLGLKIGRIVIDPGHGGNDTGTMGPSGLLEKDLVLDIAKRLASLVEARLGAEVILTRTDDTYIPLERRTAIANEHKADLFLSIHANSSPLRASSGVETFYLNFTTDKAALDVAARENASSQKTVFELRDLVQQIALQDKVDESRQFAVKVQQAVFSASARANKQTRNRGVKKAPFVVLIGASMPSVLAEIGFVSNPRDEALFKKGDFRQKLADGLYRGISQYADTLSHYQVAQK
jgi:N-acetylmuramoyl-L-alanine amidase